MDVSRLFVIEQFETVWINYTDYWQNDVWSVVLCQKRVLLKFTVSMFEQVWVALFYTFVEYRHLHQHGFRFFLYTLFILKMLYTIFKFTPNVNATNYNSISLVSLSWTFQKVNKFNKYIGYILLISNMDYWNKANILRVPSIYFWRRSCIAWSAKYMYIHIYKYLVHLLSVFMPIETHLSCMDWSCIVQGRFKMLHFRQYLQ